jgi:integrase/recombinase XerD
MDMNSKGRRKSRKIPEVLTPEEQATLLGELEADTPAGARNNCLVRLMLDAGLRSAEVLALRQRDIDFKSGQLMVRNGKGGKDRSLWLGPDLVALLRTFMKTQAKSGPVTSSSPLRRGAPC